MVELFRRPDQQLGRKGVCEAALMDLGECPAEGRSQKDRTTIADIVRIAALYWPLVQVRHPWPTERFAVKHPR